MVFIRKIKGYYVLAHSIRQGLRVIQKTRYIGKTLPPKARLKQLQLEFLREIHGNRYKYLSTSDVELIEKPKKRLRRRSELEEAEAALTGVMSDVEEATESVE